MNKKYLIDEEDCVEHKADKIFNTKDAKEVEVLDINAVIVESATIGIRLHEYIKENKLLIVKNIGNDTNRNE